MRHVSTRLSFGGFGVAARAHPSARRRDAHERLARPSIARAASIFRPPRRSHPDLASRGSPTSNRCPSPSCPPRSPPRTPRRSAAPLSSPPSASARAPTAPSRRPLACPQARATTPPSSSPPPASPSATTRARSLPRVGRTRQPRRRRRREGSPRARRTRGVPLRRVLPRQLGLLRRPPDRGAHRRLLQRPTREEAPARRSRRSTPSSAP